MDAKSALIAALIGSIVAVVSVPLWRSVGGALDGPITIITYIAFLIAMVVVVRQIPPAFPEFLGGWVFTLGVLRFATGWRNPVPLEPPSELEPRPIQRGLALALVLPLLALIIVIVIIIAAEFGMFR